MHPARCSDDSAGLLFFGVASVSPALKQAAYQAASPWSAKNSSELLK